ncbi:MAG: hypothetical protein O7G83_15475, partial [Proteobacteria bacterium]|nr:hypothetical protein [Pseudomonadota bacterium]
LNTEVRSSWCAPVSKDDSAIEHLKGLLAANRRSVVFIGAGTLRHNPGIDGGANTYGVSNEGE